MLLMVAALQAERLLDSYHCWGVDMDGQGDSPESCPGDANIVSRFVECLLAVVEHLQCRGVQ